ncbi:MAG TPA: DNA alkylation repair protein [Candidatus Baltobacteraceae bacterium]|jgi:3-methyladenine DNA glycosylase AlkD|nr:DNA alkylation repair protein [Candidatus Baltobacteraceae bacterium]
MMRKRMSSADRLRYDQGDLSEKGLEKMTAKEILEQLKPLGRESYKKVLTKNHGVKEPCFGVPVSAMKVFQKRIKKDYQLALELYDTGNYDAMYLAGLIADDARMTRTDLQRWAEKASGGALPSATVPWVAAGSPHGKEMALKWIESPKSQVAIAGWATLRSLVSIKEDSELDLQELKDLLERVRRSIHQTPDVVRSQMNGFLIAVGIYVKPLTESALQIGEKIGPVTADLGDNDCKVPFAPDYIRKAQKRGAIGKKRKSAKC